MIENELTSEGDSLKDNVIGKTKGGKEVKVTRAVNGYYGIRFSSGGKLPSNLTGKYLTFGAAKLAVERYLVGQKNNGKSID